ncbi:aldo/keto reductase [Rhodococcus sp. ACS1]|uniref:aldo/keto reductase n=1 Tax=Rhodococcus sp. ACS1 TaxID=2028570 RepID=UPI000BB11E83|nr:aldo/keto reductase [Rhodococcus sp. ACS1]PBC35604.1 aldo/keto reductase [Rhodococcus sp. ACS1]
MRYQLFGRSGLRVSELCLGTLGFGSSKESERVSDLMAQKLFERFAEAGGNFIDTAATYADGNSERTVGRLVKVHRDDFVISTKYSLQGGVSPLRAGNSRRNLRRTVEESLMRLGTDYIDILYLHAWDFATQWWEILSGMDDLISSGKVQYVAVSNTPAWQVSRAITMAELRGWDPFIGVQVRYSLIDRTAEREFLPMAKELDLAVAAWSPLGGGVLASHDEPGDVSVRGKPISPEARRTAAAVRAVAIQRGCTPAQVSISWLRTFSSQWGGVIPVVGCSTDFELEDVLSAMDVVLEQDEFELLSPNAPIR